MASSSCSPYATARSRARNGSATVVSESEREAAALPELAPDFDLAPEEPCVLLGDREAKARAATGTGRIRLVEALEQVWQVLGWDPGSPVDHLDEGADPFAADAHGRRVTAVLKRVPNQIGDDPLEAARVARDNRLVGVEPHAPLPTARPQRRRGQRG